MASRKRSPSFEIPDAVRQAGQSGWVYRTGDGQARPKTTRPSAPLPRHRTDRVTAVTDVAVVPVPAPTEPPEITNTEPEIRSPESGVLNREPETRRSDSLRAKAIEEPTLRHVASSASAGQAAGAQSMAGWLFGLGVQLALVPIVVPLYLLSSALCRTFGMNR